LGFDDTWKPRLEHLRDTSVQLLASGLEQRLIGDIFDQGVLETVGGVGRGAAAKHELRGDQLVEPALQLLLRPVSDRGEQLVRELAADHGADLGKLLDRGQPVEPRHQRIVQVRRDRKRRQRARKLVMIASIGHEARFEHCPGQLLEEQGHAVGTLQDLI
jgi:hypothetical protein